VQQIFGGEDDPPGPSRPGQGFLPFGRFASSLVASTASTTSSPRPSTANAPETWPSAAIRSAFPPTSTSPATRNTMWGNARARWEPSPYWYAMGGVYNAVAGFRAKQVPRCRFQHPPQFRCHRHHGDRRPAGRNWHRAARAAGARQGGRLLRHGAAEGFPHRAERARQPGERTWLSTRRCTAKVTQPGLKA